MTNENELSDEELEAATAPTPPVPPTTPGLPESDTEPTTNAPEGARTHSAADAQSLNVDDYRPEPGTATFKDDRNGEDVELSGEAKSNPDLDRSNFEQEFPKRHVVSRREPAEHESGKDLDVIAREVLAGDWGSGQDRRVLLDRFGYDPNKVQARSVAILNAEALEADKEMHDRI